MSFAELQSELNVHDTVAHSKNANVVTVVTASNIEKKLELLIK